MKPLLILSFLAFTCALCGAEDTTENRTRQVERYFMAVPPKELFTDVAEQIVKSVPPEQRDLVHKAFNSYLDIDVLVTAMKAAMIKHFTADELSALADFYGSPVGKSAMKKMGVYMAEMMPLMQKEIARVGAKIEADLKSAAKP
jgi:hypothetical protein